MNMPDTSSSPPSRLAEPRRTGLRRWLAALLLGGIVFSSGAIVGGGLALVVVRNGLLKAIHHPELAPARITQRLRRVLDLDDAQAAHVEQILRRRQKNLQAIRRRVQPEVVDELRKVEEEVAAVLRPEQRELWEDRSRRFRETWVPALPEKATADKPDR